MTPNYYIPKTNVPFQSTLVVGYSTYEPVLVLNPNATYSKLECNQLLTQLEQLCNLERRPSHRSSSQQPIESMEVITVPIVIRQTQPLHQTIWPSVPIMGTIERPLVQRSILVTTLFIEDHPNYTFHELEQLFCKCFQTMKNDEKMYMQLRNLPQ